MYQFKEAYTFLSQSWCKSNSISNTSSGSCTALLLNFVEQAPNFVEVCVKFLPVFWVALSFNLNNKSQLQQPTLYGPSNKPSYVYSH